MNNKIKRAAAALCGCTLLAASLTGCGGSEAESVMDSTVTVEVQNVRRGSIQLQGTYVGTVSASESVNVIPLVQGATVESVNVSVGSEVKEGQVLAKLDSTSADLTAENAQAAYNSALAQAQSALGGQWKTNIYSAERGIDQLDDNIDTMNDQIDKLKDQKNQINNGYKNAKIAYETLNGANECYKKLKPSVSVQVNEKNKQILGLPENSSGSTTLKIDEDEDYKKLEKLVALGEESGISEGQLPDVRAIMNYVNAQKAAGRENAAIWASLTDDNVNTAKKGYEQAEAALENVEKLESSIEQLETQRDSLKAQKETAEGTLDITQGETYNETVASLQAGLAQAQVGLDSAAYQQSLYTLTSPINGTIESVGLTKDGMASASSIAFTISNKDTMQVTFYVAEDVRDEFTAGQPVTVSRGDKTYSGTITEIGNAVDMQKGLFKVKATIYDMPDLASGVTASITTTCHSANNVVVIPCDAVYYENGDAYVFVAKDGVAVKTPVETGIYNDTDIAITSGLTEGQQVITTWSANLIDGSSITIPGQDESESNAASSAESSQG